MKNRKYILTLNWLMMILLFSTSTLHAQNSKKSTNSAYLIELSSRLERIYQEYQATVQQYAFERDILLREVTEQGRTYSLIRIMPSGLPEYYMTHNQRAAINVGTTKLRPRADLALNLTGEGITIGVWDSGSTNVEHQEFGDRVEIKDNIPFDDHGTHVAGTIAAAGINPEARGMAYETNIFAYEFNNDNAEMAREAAEDLIISNHSYGLRTGWDVATGGTGWQWFGDPSVSNVEDYRFGYYDASNSRVWDDIAFNAPFYLIVKSAGNDRTDVGDGTRPPDGPYDCLEPKSVAKNILTIGAVEHLDGEYTGPEDVVMSAFSSWGPTDDGRIKPDISAIGVDVFSTLSGGVDVYGTQSGTSMSAPNTTGSLALLQEYYAQLHSGSYMRSATLRGLSIHTANEAGKNPGPDYEFGWGLLAVDKAANLITRTDGTNFIIDELNLNEGDSIVYEVSSDGTAPLIATICWTDVPGNPAPISLNPSDLMLVNDLDMRIYDEGGVTFTPWILDPDNPDRGATFGDNFRDNVEKIEIAEPIAGTYTIVIKHKNSLRNGDQDFSLIVSNSALNLDLQTMFWIGGSGGVWNDPNNWSFSSGGNVANAVPTINNPVIFDNNSFSQPVNSIFFSSVADCYNINYYSTDSCSFNLSAFTLNIDGSISDTDGNSSFNNGTLRFNGTISKNNQIEMDENAFSNIDFQFNSLNGSWSINNNFNANSITIVNSSLSVVNQFIQTRSIVANTNSFNTIDFSGSTISGINVLDVANVPNSSFGNSTILFDNQNGIIQKTITATNSIFSEIRVDGASLVISGDNSIANLKINGNLELTGSNTIDSLRLSDISSMTIQENSTQTVVESFEAVGSVGNRIEIQSSGSAVGNLFSNRSDIRYCLDYLEVVNVSVSGNTSFLSGENSIINENSVGWIELDCDDALFPSFEIEFPCAMGETRFIDTSTGFPTEWNWNFGNLQFPDENFSTDRNPFHHFRFPGQYQVTFNTVNSQFNETITRTITIIDYESSLGVPSINVDGTRLTASIIAPSYQWYLNDNPINGANERVFEIANPGTYYVTVSDENCLFRSEAMVVTSLEEKLSSSSFKIYPNPSGGQFVVELSDIDEGLNDARLSVYDLVGHIVHMKNVQLSSNSVETALDLSQLPDGMYHLSIAFGNKKMTKKLILKR